MRSWWARVQRFVADENGPTAVEYAVMLAMIIVICVAAITALGSNTNRLFGTVRDSMPAGT